MKYYLPEPQQDPAATTVPKLPPWGDTRVVGLGDEIVIRFPGVAATGAPRWRLTSFDSLMMSLSQRPRLEDDTRGGRRWTIRFTARTPGETEVVITRTAVDADGRGTIGERRRFRIRILE